MKYDHSLGYLTDGLTDEQTYVHPSTCTHYTHTSCSTCTRTHGRARAHTHTHTQYAHQLLDMCAHTINAPAARHARTRARAHTHTHTTHTLAARHVRYAFSPPLLSSFLLLFSSFPAPPPCPYDVLLKTRGCESCGIYGGSSIYSSMTRSRFGFARISGQGQVCGRHGRRGREGGWEGGREGSGGNVCGVGGMAAERQQMMLLCGLEHSVSV